MKRTILALAFLLAICLLARPASAAPAIVQIGTPTTDNYSGTSTTATLTLSSAPSSSNLVVLVVFNDASSDAGNSPTNTTAGIATPSGFTAGPTHTKNTAFGGSNNPMVESIFYATGQTATSYNVTFSCDGGCKLGGYAMEISGANNASPVDVSAFNDQTCVACGVFTGATVTPTTTGELVTGGVWLNDDTEYNGNDLAGSAQTSGWTENPGPQATTNCFCYPSFEGQYLPSAGTSAVGPSGNIITGNDNAASLGNAWVITWAVAWKAASGPPPSGPITLANVAFNACTTSGTSCSTTVTAQPGDLVLGICSAGNTSSGAEGTPSFTTGSPVLTTAEWSVPFFYRQAAVQVRASATSQSLTCQVTGTASAMYVHLFDFHGTGVTPVIDCFSWTINLSDGGPQATVAQAPTTTQDLLFAYDFGEPTSGVSYTVGGGGAPSCPVTGITGVNAAYCTGQLSATSFTSVGVPSTLAGNNYALGMVLLAPVTAVTNPALFVPGGMVGLDR